MSYSHAPGGSAGAPAAAAPAEDVKLSKEEEAEFREIFRLVDKDGSGSITRDELQGLMRTLSISASQAELELMISEIDTDGDGSICYDEFRAVMSRKVSASYTPAEVKAAFRVFQGSAPEGHIKIDTLERALSVYGADRLTQAQVTDLINQLDFSEDGLFNYQAYVTDWT